MHIREILGWKNNVAQEDILVTLRVVAVRPKQLKARIAVGEEMPHLRFEELTEGNLCKVTDVCNASLTYDFLNPSTLRRITFQDPNFERLAFIAYENDEPLGLAAGCRRIRWPAEHINLEVGWIKILAGIASKKSSEVEIMDLLCEKVETDLRSLGVKVVRVSDFASGHVWPGIDVRYETILEVLEKRGYSKVGEAVDYLVGLRGFSVPRRIQKLREDLNRQGISITLATQAESESVCRWVKGKFSTEWASEVEISIRNSEKDRSGTVGTVVARDKTGEIIGFSTQGALEPHWFGPIGVDEKRRKLGVGSILLFESLKRMKMRGVIEAVICWTGHLFFYTQVPGIVGVRHYNIMSKQLA